MNFEMFPFDPKLIQTRWILGLLPSEEVPRLAQNALELGYEGKNVARLAGILHPTNADLQPLMIGFLTELGIGTTLTPEHAGLMLARIIAQGISEGWVTPYDGARFIWSKVVYRLRPNQQHRLLSFVGYASEYEDCESYSQNPEQTRREISQNIIEDARALLLTKDLA